MSATDAGMRTLARLGIAVALVPLVAARGGDVEILEQRIERRDALSFASEWLPAVRRARAEVRGKWLATHDGFLRVDLLDQELAWNARATGGPPRWRDRDGERHPLPCIVDFARQLESCGIDLVLAIAPTRLHTRPDLVLGPETRVPDDFEGLALGLQDFFVELAREGVDVVDVLPALTALADRDGPDAAGAFLRYDSHWTPRAAEVAAELVHARVAELASYEPGDLACDRVPDEVDFRTKENGLPLVPDPERLPLTRIRARDGSPLEAKASPILVMGDSYVTYHEESESAFRHHFAARCRRAIDVVSVFGRGSIGPRKTLRRRRSHPLGTKRVVVWLFSATALAEPEQWLAIDFFGGAERESDADSE